MMTEQPTRPSVTLSAGAVKLFAASSASTDITPTWMGSPVTIAYSVTSAPQGVTAAFAGNTMTITAAANAQSGVLSVKASGDTVTAMT